MIQDPVFGLTELQQKKLKALKKAYKDCLDANMLPVNIYKSLTFYNKEMVNGYGDDCFTFDGFPVELHGNSRSSNYITLPDEWCGDTSHIIYLTEKGEQLFKQEQQYL